MIGGVADWILGLHGWAALAVVFLLPALESSAFVGFVVPGEIGVLLGGVLASRGNVALGAVLAAAVAGAVVGDTVGYEVGKRWGRRILHGTLGRLVKAGHLERAERYLQTRGGKAVFFGRFTAALRVLIPGLAGLSAMPYRRFVAYNAAGGAVWATGLALAGYLAGDSWHRVEHVAGRASLVLLLLAALAAGVVLSARWAGRHQDQIRRFMAAQLDRTWPARFRARSERQLRFLARRFEPRAALGLSLTASLAVVVAAGWALGAVVQDVIAGEGSVRFDRPVLDWFAHHREPWLTTVMTAVTDLGSYVVVVPLIIAVAAWFWRQRATTRPAVLLGASYGGAEFLARAIKALTARPRPPATLAAAHFGGHSFPSGHATNATAVYGMLAYLLAATTPLWRRRVSAFAGAVAIATVVGITRLYLGAHWLTDVLAGWALGTVWLLAVVAVSQAVIGRSVGRGMPEERRGFVANFRSNRG